MQILGLLGMYFDAVVVEIEKYIFTFFFGLGLAILCSMDFSKLYLWSIDGKNSIQNRLTLHIFDRLHVATTSKN